MIKEIIDENSKKNLKIIFEKIFSDTCPFEYIFTRNIEEFMILFPTDAYCLTKKQLFALQKTMAVFGENTAYISEIEGTNLFEIIDKKYLPSKHWLIDDVVTLHENKEIKLVWENAVYSTKGNWGLAISHEDHALLGGKHEFIEQFKMNYPKWSNCMRDLLEHCRYDEKTFGTSLTWIEDLIKHDNIKL